MNIEIYSDGSSNTVEGSGGWSYRILVDGDIHAEDSGYVDKYTNNESELRGAIEGLKRVRRDFPLNEELKCTLFSDSRLVLGYANGSYACRAEHLLPLYIELRELFTYLNLNTTWIKGHSGNEHNEACDRLAKSARKSAG